jgi:DNA primase
MQIPEIKQKLTIQTVLTYYHLKADRNNMLKCPFHEEETASMRIYPDTNSFHCFGCGKNGDAIEFCCLKEGDKHKGILKSAELCSGLQPINTKPVKPPAELKENDPGVLTRIFESFTNGLHSPISKRPKAYLQARRLDYNLLEMGYNSGQYHHGGKLSEGEIKAWQAAGMLIPYKGTVPNGRGRIYTCFAKDCIIFPLKDGEGRIVSLYGRGIKENRDGTGKHFYLKNRRGLYPGYPDRKAKRLILTEAVIDAATLLQIPEITHHYEILAFYGTNGLTAEHLEAIKGLTNLEEIIFFFDGDKTGRAAMQKYQQELSRLLPNVKLTGIETPDGEDVNSLSVAHDPEIFTHLLETRKPFLLTETVLTEIGQGGDHRAPQDPTVPAGVFNARNPEFITFTTQDLKMVILGGVNLQQLDRLRLTIKISRSDTADPLHSIRHTLDLYHSDYLEKFIAKASEQLEMGSNTIRRALAELTERIEQYRISRIESLKEEKPRVRQLTEQRKAKAIGYLKSENLMERTGRDISATGIVGEKHNSLLMYLVFTSRLRDQPLHVIGLGASGTGKTYLQEKIAGLIPEQDKLEITILSENAFYYFDRRELKNKLVLIEDMDGAEQVLYPLRELQTKRKISKTIPVKDSKGNLKTITLRVEGPICLAGTTTRERLYEDNANRSLLIYLDESREHKEQIMEYQRRLSAGKIDTRKENELKELFKDMQTLLKPIAVRNPYAEYLKLPEYVFKPLRTNAHYLAVIETITFYHQWQREVKTDPESSERYIETSLEDIRWANKLLRDVLLVKSDELPRAVRDFFEGLKYHLKVKGKESFYAREIRSHLRMNPMTINRYLREMESRSFIRRTGGNRKAGFEYEITSWDDYSKLQTGVKVLEDIYYKLEGKYNRSITSRDVTLKPSEVPAR